MKTGQQLQSQVCSTKVVVIRKPASDESSLFCGGVVMVDAGLVPVDRQSSADPGLRNGSQLGKRYSEPNSGIQVLCVNGGDGTLTIDGAELAVEESKKLPSSD